MLRAIAKRLSRGVVLKRRLPPEFGRNQIFVSPDAGLRFYRRNLRVGDAILFKMAEELVKPGDIVWDVGANVGLFTLAAANRAGNNGEVIAIEADVWLVSLLQRSCELLDRTTNATVTIVPAAASDSIGLEKFHIASRWRRRLGRRWLVHDRFADSTSASDQRDKAHEFSMRNHRHSSHNANELQLLRVACPNRNDHSPAFSELMHQCGRQFGSHR